MIDEAIIVSSPQLETADTVTVYLAFPEEQLVILLKTPTLIPGAAVDVLNCGVVAIAQALEPPLPPPVGFALCADSGIDKSVEQTTAKTTRFIEILIISLLRSPTRTKRERRPCSWRSVHFAKLNYRMFNSTYVHYSLPCFERRIQTAMSQTACEDRKLSEFLANSSKI
jgi:hypothetical protein